MLFLTLAQISRTPAHSPFFTNQEWILSGFMTAKIFIEEAGKENWDNYQPEVTLHKMRNYIQIAFIKKEADAMNIYKRCENNATWLFTAMVTDSPFDDYDVDPRENTEYRFLGVLDKNEIGLPLVIHLNNPNADQ
jgi:hypothetical protein